VTGSRPVRILAVGALIAGALTSLAIGAGDTKGTKSRPGCLLTANPVKVVLDDDTGTRVERYRATIVCKVDQPRDERRFLSIKTPTPSEPCEMAGLRAGTIYRCTATSPAVCNDYTITRAATATLYTRREGRRVGIVTDRAPRASYSCSAASG
jgi:hypothetical protein